MGMVYREVKQATIDIEMMFDLLWTECRDHWTVPAPHRCSSSEGRVQIRGRASFSLRSARGKSCAACRSKCRRARRWPSSGPSGAGKSTISRLMFRFYEPSAGRITIDGQDVAAVTQDELAREDRHGAAGHGAVQRHDRLQHPLRPLGRLRRGGARRRAAGADRPVHRNRAGGLFGAGRGARAEAVRRREAAGGDRPHDFEGAADPHSRRSNLGAGFSFTEREIQASLEQVSRGRTTLVIAHRLSTIVGADEIIVLDAGRIVERGTHDGLLGAPRASTPRCGTASTRSTRPRRRCVGRGQGRFRRRP